MGNRIILITQARIGSTRFPAKVLKKIGNKSILEIQLDRVTKCSTINKVLVAIPDGIKEYPIRNICKNAGIEYSLGSENDVLDRYYNAVKNENAGWVVRITSDCPLIDPELIDNIVKKVILKNVDYGSNTIVETFPDGQDIEVFKFSVLEKIWKDAILKSDREHVTPYIKRNCQLNSGKLFDALSFENIKNFSNVRMTVDELQDFKAIDLLIKKLGYNASWLDYTNFILKNKDLFPNQNIIRNEGYLRSLKND